MYWNRSEIISLLTFSLVLSCTLTTRQYFSVTTHNFPAVFAITVISYCKVFCLHDVFSGCYI